MMLNRTLAPVPVEVGKQPSADESAGIDLAGIFGFVRRHWPLVVAIAGASLVLASLYLVVTPPHFLGTANLLLDTRQLKLAQQQPLFNEVVFDDPAVESEIEVVRSETVAASAVDELKLADDGEFTGETSSFVGSIASAVSNLFGSSGPKLGGPDARSVEARTRVAIGYLRSNLRVQRLRMTYVIEIGFTSLDPGKAARVANAVAEAYILEQTQTKAYTTKRAVNWIHDRMMELRQQAIDADRIVQDFRTKNNLVKVGITGTVEEQQFADLNTQLIKAREQTAEARVRLDRIKAIMASRLPDASMTAWLSNDVINRLRQQYTDAKRQEADYAVRLGPEHQAVVNLQKQIKEIEGSAQDELRRIAEGFKNDFEIAQARERAVETKLAEQTKTNASSRLEYGALAVLESEAKAYQTLHDSFLTRYAEAQQQLQQNVTTTEARVITAASGAQKVSPQTRQVLSLGAILGLMLGVGAAYAREQFDRAFRTPKQVEKALGVECLGVLPAIEAKSTPRKSDPSPKDIAERAITQDLGIARQVILAPFSRFTETIRNIKVAADTSTTTRGVQVVGLVSAVPAEGKSTVAANLAQLAAHGGRRALLVDADLRNPSLTRLMTPAAKEGLLDVLQGTRDLAGVVWRDPITGLDFLPAVLGKPIAHTSELLASRKMAELISNAREQYDYVILDFPPLAPVVDAKAASHFVDGFILVIEWGQTSPEVISESLGSSELVQSKLIGAVLNRANPSAMKKIEAYKGKNYHRYYTSYLSDSRA